MQIEILTLFPEMFEGPFSDSLMARAQTKGLVSIAIHDMRQYGMDERKTIDDRPYGGGVGMIIKVEPIYKALADLKTSASKVILLTPRGKLFNQKMAQELSTHSHLILIAGRYEGFDERIHEHLVDEEVSIGDYVLMGGELPAMVLTETVVRLIPGVITKDEAKEKESFSDANALEHPQYTRPEEFMGWKVPPVLLSGNHVEIEKWKKETSFSTTLKNRPDLIQKR